MPVRYGRALPEWYGGERTIIIGTSRQEIDMALRTRLTQLLDIRHPVVLAPMDLVAGARLAAEVTRAGGFGILGGGYGDETWLRQELDRIADMNVRFGVGFITWSMARQPRVLELTLER